MKSTVLPNLVGTINAMTIQQVKERDYLGERSSSIGREVSETIAKPYRPHGTSSNGGSSGGTAAVASYRPPGKRGKGSNMKNRRSQLWCETFDHAGLEEVEIKRQEAIYELFQGERVMVDDLKMAKQTYRDSMITLKMLNEAEVSQIFGKLDCLLPLHENLLSRLQLARNGDGRTERVGHVFIDWFPSLSPYDEYCANQADAKEMLDAVINREGRVRDFLQRCLESPFSRKLDLWSYLDLPRSRLVKYPLLLKAIHKATPSDHEDSLLLQNAIDIINDIISRVDNLTGERQAKFVKSKLEYLDEKQKCPEIGSSRKIICSGQLKSSRGAKLHVFLFDRALVMTRNATRGEKFSYQVYRQPLALKNLIVDPEEGGRLSGSFRGNLLSTDKAKHSFRVKSEEVNISYTLVATDEHDKKQWVNSIQEAINVCRMGVRDGTSLRKKSFSITQTETLEKEKSSAISKLEKKMSLKRTASVKSDSGSTSPWYRNRSLTSASFRGRRSSKDKKDLSEEMSKSNLASSSRYSRSSLLELLTGSDVPKRKFSLDDKVDWRRSRSLASSPIAFLASFPRRKPRSGSGLARSESCYTKPPIGRTATFSGRLNSRSSMRTPPKSPRMGSSQSIPDLISSDRMRSNSEHCLTLEAVCNRLAQVASGMDKPASLYNESKLIPREPESVASSKRASPSSSHVSIDAFDNHSLSWTSGHSIAVDVDHSKSNESLISASLPVAPSSSDESNQQPSILSTSPPELQIIEADVKVSSCSSLADTSYVMNDTEMIVERTINEETIISDFSNDPIPVEQKNDIVQEEVDLLLSEIIGRVCDVPPCMDPPKPAFTVSVSCNGDYITLLNDDGLPWAGNDVELMV